MDTAGPAMLGYDLPGGGSLVYSQVDSGQIRLDLGGQVLDMTALSNQVVEMAFTRGEEGLQVTANWQELDASMSNPMQGTMRLSEEDLTEPLVFTLDARGRARVVSKPEVPAGLSQLFSADGVAQGFFPRLPGQAPEPGMSWTDTVTYEMTEGGMTAENRSVETYSIAGDTLVDGMTLLKINLVARESVFAEGRQQGMEMVQDLSGTTRGYILWDLARGVMYSRFEESELDGTTEVDQVPYPMELTVEARSYVKLVQN
jgi:hypothetical protein